MLGYLRMIREFVHVRLPIAQKGATRLFAALGSTDRHGTAPSAGACTPEDIAATIFHLLGFPPTHRLVTLRDATIFPDGRVLDGVLEA
jgi:hypothetical protein